MKNSKAQGFSKINGFIFPYQKEQIQSMNYRVKNKEAKDEKKPLPVILPKQNNLHIVMLMSVASAVAFAMHIYFSFMAQGGFFENIVGILFSATYASVICSNTSRLTKILPLAAGIVSVFAGIFAAHANAQTVVNVLLAVLFDVTLCVCIIYSAVKGLSRSFAIVTVSTGIVVNILVGIVAAFILKYGTFSVDLLLEKINLFFDLIRQSIMTQTENLLQSEQFANSLKAGLSSSGLKEISSQEILDLMKTSSKYVLESVKLMLPSIVCIYAMAIASVVTMLFSVCTKVCRTKIYYGRKWIFAISGVGARIYNVLFFISIVGSFFGMSQLLSVTFINVVIILAPGLCYVAIKDIVAFLKRKRMKPLSATMLTFVIIAVATGILGISSAFLLALIGVHTTTAKERIKIIIYKD